MSLLKCLVFFVFLIAKVSSEVCEDGVQFHLATKSPYRLVANLNHSKVEYPGCTPLKIWMLVRHGTRNPSQNYIQEMKYRLVALRDKILSSKNAIINSDLTAFKKWDNRLEYEDEKNLTPEGANEMVEIAERMQARFPELLSHIYSNTSYKFRFTHTRRTKASALYFAVGLFGKKTARDVWFPEPLKLDPILRFYKLCDKWRRDVKKNTSSLVELSKFVRSNIMLESIAQMEKTLGFKKNTLTFDDLHYMFMTCAFETAWSRKKKSPWCSIFSTETAKVLEYAEDLKYYWIDGYGHSLTYDQACPAFKDMYEFLDDLQTYPKSTLYFTHSGTLLKMLAHLGVYKDEQPLTSKKIDNDRKWKVSKIDPFGTNLAFVSFKCGKEKKLLTMHQERVIRLPSCPEEDLCDLKKVKQYYQRSLENCDFQNMCRI